MLDNDHINSLLPSANAGDAKAQYGLAMAYATSGEGDPEEDVEAWQWLNLAADQGYPDALMTLGSWLSHGAMGPRDPERGRTLLQEAIAKGSGRAALMMHNLTAGNPFEAQGWLKKAVPMLTASAEAGDGHALFELTKLILEEGSDLGVPVDVERWLIEGAKFGMTDAQREAALILLTRGEAGKDVHTFLTEAASYGDEKAEALLRALNEVPFSNSADLASYVATLERDAEQGNTHAQTAFGLLNLYGLGIQRSAGKARHFLRTAAEQGNQTAQYVLGRNYPGEAPLDVTHSRAETWLHLAAERGHVESQYALGLRYERGMPNKDTGKAKHWYKLAAEAGHVEAQLALAAMYDTARAGEGGPKKRDDGKAFSLFLMAAEQGNAHGQAAVARMLVEGRGTDQDHAQAMAWYQKAVAGGADVRRGWASYSVACLEIGRMYEAGLGAPRDFGQAIHWYRKAADHGVEEAYLRLGALYENGLGVPRDIKKAIKFYRAAAKWLIDDGELADDLHYEATLRLGRLEEQGHALDLGPAEPSFRSAHV